MKPLPTHRDRPCDRHRFHRRIRPIRAALIESLESRIAPAFVTGTVDASEFSVSHSAVYHGATGQSSGFSVSIIGDFNGDGIADYAISAATENGATGAVYVIFGEFGQIGPSINLSSIDNGDGSTGFKITGEHAGDEFGQSVGAAGDLNGDSIADLVIGAPSANTGAGAAYVIFGHHGSFSPALNLSGLNGSNGFKMNGLSAADGLGSSVSGAGDINGDGTTDLLLGAPGVLSTQGAVYLIFGHKGAYPAVLDLSKLNGLDGLVINGSNANGVFGSSVSGLGDVNGDGIGDFIVGSPGTDNGAGRAPVFYGRTSFTDTPQPGFAISAQGNVAFRLQGASAGDALGTSVSGVGDINGDGIADILVGAPGVNGGAGAAYVFYGEHGRPVGLSFLPSALNGTNGFSIPGLTGDDAGTAVSGGGDVNGDGISDFMIDAPAGNSHTGATYVVFGKTGGFGASFDVSTLSGSNGFRITGANQPQSISGGGDVNGDGYDDILAGAQSANSNAGATYLVYGGPSGLGAGSLTTGGTFTDVDGDLVTVKTSKPLPPGDFDFLTKSSNPLREELLGINLGQEAAGVSISLTVKRAPGGDGRVNVGFIDAHGVDLGAVKIMGDLGGIDAGAGDALPAIKSLTLGSFGAFGGHTEDTGSEHRADIIGAVGPVKIAGDVDARFRVLDGAAAGTGTIASVTVGGSLRGGVLSGSGSIFASGAVGPVKIAGNIAGSSGSYSGYLQASGDVASITLGGSLLGSSGDFSGTLDIFAKAGNITIKGGVLGGSGLVSGSINTTGDMGKVTIGQSLICGDGEQSGLILAFDVGANIAGVTIGGDARGGDALFAGGIIADGSLGPVVIKGSVIGASEKNPFLFRGAGPLTGPKSLAIAGIKVGGSLEDALVLAGFGLDNSPVNSHAQIGKISVGGDWIATSVSAGAVDGNGYITRLGAGDESLILGGNSTAIASIAAITIKGQAMGSFAPGDFYGIIAEQIGSVSVAGQKVPLTKGKSNDLVGIDIGLTPDFVIREVERSS